MFLKAIWVRLLAALGKFELDPEECNAVVKEYGTGIFMTGDVPRKAIDEWVKAIVQDSRQAVDWHYMAGRGVILCYGNTKKASASLRKLRHIHDEAMAATYREANDRHHVVNERGEKVPFYSEEEIQRRIEARWAT